MNENKKFNLLLEKLIEEAACIVAEEMGNEISEPKEEIIFSERHEKIMQKLFQQEREKARKSNKSTM